MALITPLTGDGNCKSVGAKRALPLPVSAPFHTINEAGGREPCRNGKCSDI